MPVPVVVLMATTALVQVGVMGKVMVEAKVIPAAKMSFLTVVNTEEAAAGALRMPQKEAKAQTYAFQ
jgi:hypothetical protein